MPTISLTKIDFVTVPANAEIVVIRVIDKETAEVTFYMETSDA